MNDKILVWFFFVKYAKHVASISVDMAIMPLRGRALSGCFNKQIVSKSNHQANERPTNEYLRSY